MTTLHRVVVAWSGNAVKGAAVNVLHFSASDNSAPPVAALLSAYGQIAPALANTTTITIPGTGDTIDDTTGNLVGVWTAAGAGSVTGSGTPISAAGVGACISWTTGGIVTGLKGPRKLRGRTFLVPLQNGAYDADGTLTTGTVAALQSAANAMQASGPLAIWHRPTSPGASNGNSYGVISARVKDKVAILRSRRD